LRIQLLRKSGVRPRDSVLAQRLLKGIKESLHQHLSGESILNTEEKIRAQLQENPIILYMKGTPDAPECGFSAKAVAAIKSTGTDFAYVNVVAAPFIREKLPSVSNWPTYPQLFVNGEIVGGSDIIEELHAKSELLPILESAKATVN
jgi:monothiol glutaredoxin